MAVIVAVWTDRRASPRTNLPQFEIRIVVIPARPGSLILPAALLNRGRRRSRRLMTELGAVPDNGIAVEPREAQRPADFWPRAAR